MPFDAGFLNAMTGELKESVCGGRVDKIYQPSKEEIVLSVRNNNRNYKLLLCAVAGASRVSLTEREFENPPSPPMLCMLLRKHLSGGHIVNVTQPIFDRVLEVEISSRDEMGFKSTKFLVVEIMGTYSNIIFLNDDRKVLSTLRTVDITSNMKRKIIPGFEYELPPVQEGKVSPLGISYEYFEEKAKNALLEKEDIACDRFVLSSFSGVSPLISREISFRATKSTSFLLKECELNKLYFHFNSIYGNTSGDKYKPCIIYDKNSVPVEYSFIDILQYGNGAVVKYTDTFSELTDLYFAEKDAKEKIRRRGQDILKLLSNASVRVTKKIELQNEDLAKCENREQLKLYGDLITANMYMIKKGDTSVKLPDYTKDDFAEVEVPLESNLTPSQNAQKYYKRYAKLKSAREVLAEQLEKSRAELEYIDTVFESLTKAHTEEDLSEIRDELAQGGYARKLSELNRDYLSKKKGKGAKKTYAPMKFVTSCGFTVYCGKNNLQNDYISFTLASKNDIWFHAKKTPGSHVVLCTEGREPEEIDYTEAAIIAAYYSSGRKTPSLGVDYTRVRNLKKPNGSKPGFVVYDTNYTAFVTADEELVNSLKAQKG